jgi:putative transposase
VILTAFSKKAIGYALSKRIDTKLTLGSLKLSIYDRRLAPGCIHQSDLVFRYASCEYVKELEPYVFQISMNRKANPHKNAHAESFIKTLTSDEVSP